MVEVLQDLDGARAGGDKVDQLLLRLDFAACSQTIAAKWCRANDMPALALKLDEIHKLNKELMLVVLQEVDPL